MTGPAIILMVVTILIIWGGLVGSIIALRVLPEPEPTAAPVAANGAIATDNSMV